MDLFGEADLAEAQGFDLMEEMRRRGGANLSQTNSPQAQAQHMAARQRQIQERALAQQAARRSSPFATGANTMSVPQYTQNMHQYQGQLLNNMAQQATGAWQDEHDSRVAQIREMRRMEHEKELKRMELDALLARLNQAREPSGPQPRAVFRGGAIY